MFSVPRGVGVLSCYVRGCLGVAPSGLRAGECVRFPHTYVRGY